MPTYVKLVLLVVMIHCTGIDEVGRGCWAGPVVAAAVYLETEIVGLADSKQLSAARRQFLSQIIYESAQVSLGWVHADEFNSVGLSRSVQLAVERAVSGLPEVLHKDIIIDGSVNYLHSFGGARAVIKADLSVAAVSAASIVAKVARDQYMFELATRYPDYGFERHVGYGTAKHRRALQQLGITPEHRLSYKPVQAIMRGAAAA